MTKIVYVHNSKLTVFGKIDNEQNTKHVFFRGVTSASGSIPAELGQLFELELLVLNDNKLVGGVGVSALCRPLSDSSIRLMAYIVT